MNTKKGQVSVEILAVLGVVVIGSIIAASFYIGNINKNVEEGSDLSKITDNFSDAFDDFEETNNTGTGSGGDDDDENQTVDPCANHCTNGIMDCGETGVDCGGDDCTACTGANPCENHCDNGIFDPQCGETGTDCGGDCPDSCTGQYFDAIYGDDLTLGQTAIINNAFALRAKAHTNSQAVILSKVTVKKNIFGNFVPSNGCVPQDGSLVSTGIYNNFGFINTPDGADMYIKDVDFTCTETGEYQFIFEGTLDTIVKDSEDSESIISKTIVEETTNPADFNAAILFPLEDEVYNQTQSVAFAAAINGSAAASCDCAWYAKKIPPATNPDTTPSLLVGAASENPIFFADYTAYSQTANPIATSSDTTTCSSNLFKNQTTNCTIDADLFQLVEDPNTQTYTSSEVNVGAFSSWTQDQAEEQTDGWFPITTTSCDQILTFPAENIFSTEFGKYDIKVVAMSDAAGVSYVAEESNIFYTDATSEWSITIDPAETQVKNGAALIDIFYLGDADYTNVDVWVDHGSDVTIDNVIWNPGVDPVDVVTQTSIDTQSGSSGASVASVDDLDTLYFGADFTCQMIEEQIVCSNSVTNPADVYGLYSNKHQYFAISSSTIGTKEFVIHTLDNETGQQLDFNLSYEFEDYQPFEVDLRVVVDPNNPNDDVEVVDDDYTPSNLDSGIVEEDNTIYLGGLDYSSNFVYESAYQDVGFDTSTDSAVTTIYQNTGVTLIPVIEGGSQSYACSWSLNDGPLNWGCEGPFGMSMMVPGEHTFEFTVVDVVETTNIETRVAQFNVVVPPFTMQIDSPVSDYVYQDGANIELNSSVSGITSYTCDWRVDGVQETTQCDGHTETFSEGTHVVELTVTADDGNAMWDYVVFDVQPEQNFFSEIVISSVITYNAGHDMHFQIVGETTAGAATIYPENGCTWKIDGTTIETNDCDFIRSPTELSMVSSSSSGDYTVTVTLDDVVSTHNALQEYEVRTSSDDDYNPPSDPNDGPDGDNTGGWTNPYDDLCFAEGSLVLTESGYRPIETIKVNDMVYSLDDKTNELVKTKVTKLLVHNELSRSPTVVLTLSDSTRITATANHPFYDPVLETYKKISKFVVGDELYKYSSIRNNFELVKIESMEIVDDLTTSYNLSLENPHNYLVHGVLVHNIWDKGSTGTIPDSSPSYCQDAYGFWYQCDGRASEAM